MSDFLVREILKDPPVRVCVVDDNPASLSAITALLFPTFDVTVARTGRDALRLIAQMPPDVVLLDIEMPDMDGLEVCRRLKQDPVTRDLPIVFLTGHGDEATELAGLKAGGADFIAKPPKGPSVCARIHNLVLMKRLTERLRMEAQTDAPTGLGNRAKFAEVLNVELARARRLQQEVSLLMVDVDHFKAYNDHYGHLTGDSALQHVAKAMLAATPRAGDVVCRYGGEEFAVILPATNDAGATRVAAGIRDMLNMMALPHQASPVSPWITLSIGLATNCHAHGADHARYTTQASGRLDPSDDLVARADSALYAAKRHGRNQAWADDGTGSHCVLGGQAPPP
jgi:diguanylate cyclase (GGDEF)-like protein